MSLDVYLNRTAKEREYVCASCGHEHFSEKTEEVYSANITHNLGKMAHEAGIYKYLWRPEEIGVSKAADLIEPLGTGLADMKARPDHYKQFDSPNGWGLYIHFVPWIENYLQACKDYPDADVSVSR